MSEMSNYLEAAFLDHILRGDTGGTDLAQPAGVYLALHTANPDEDASGAEVAGGSYDRQLIAFGAASSPSGVSLNTGTATYNGLPTCTVTHVALWDDTTSGNMLFYTSLSSPIVFNSGDGASVAVGALSVTLA